MVALIAVGIVLVCAQVTSLLGRTQKRCQVRRWQEHHLSLEKPRVSSFFFLFDSELVCRGGVGGLPETGAGGSWGEHGSGAVGTGNLGLVAPPAPSLSRSQHVHLHSDLSGTCPPLPHPAFLSVVLNTKWENDVSLGRQAKGVRQGGWVCLGMRGWV